MSKIKKIIGRQILDSRGNPTIEVDVYTTNGFGRAAIPSGASTGIYEALELRDNQKAFCGKSVLKAVKNINIISKKLSGLKISDQHKIDEELIKLDGTENKSRLGANSMLGVSLACARAASENKPLYTYLSTLTKSKPILPIPFVNVINGGKHASGALPIQEIMIVPTKFSSYSKALQATVETYHEIKRIISKKYGDKYLQLGDEGGFAPPIKTARQAFDLLETAIGNAGYNNKIQFAMDAAASEFYDKKKYIVEKTLSRDELIDYYLDLIHNYPIISIEDCFDQNDFDSFAMLKNKSKIQIVGDDLLVTNTKRIKIAKEKNACNCLLLKVNQIGTLSESINAANLSKKYGWNVMVSHRSGETEDSFIADLAVSLGCGQIKTGAPARGERTSKYNQLLRIEEELGSKAKYGKLK